MTKKSRDPALEVWEHYIQSHVLQTKSVADGISIREIEQEVEGSEEKWVQQYVKRHHRRLGFLGIKGPFTQGPDFHVRKNVRWIWAEVETKWQNYYEHGHRFNC